MCFLFYWLIMYLFPRASAAESGGVWGSAPKGALQKLVCGVLKNVSSSGCRHSWFFLQRSLLSAEGAKYLLSPIPSRNLTIRVRKRNEQLNLIIGVCFHPSRWPELAPFQSFLLYNLTQIVSFFSLTLSH